MSVLTVNFGFCLAVFEGLALCVNISVRDKEGGEQGEAVSLLLEVGVYFFKSS